MPVNFIGTCTKVNFYKKIRSKNLLTEKLLKKINATRNKNHVKIRQKTTKKMQKLA